MLVIRGSNSTFFDQPFGIAVDQPIHASAQFGELCRCCREIWTVRTPLPRVLKAPFVFRRDPGRIAQQAFDLAPDRLVQPVGAKLGVCSEAVAVEAESVAAAATVIGVTPNLTLCGPQADRLAIISIAAPAADQQALQEVACASGGLSAAGTVLGKLLAHGIKQRGIDQSGHWNPDPLGWRHVVETVGATRLFAAATDGSEPVRPRPDPGFPEGGLADIGGVPQHTPQRLSGPRRLYRGGSGSLAGASAGTPRRC